MRATKSRLILTFWATYLRISGLFAIRREIIVCFFCGEVVYMNYWSEREKEKGCVIHELLVRKRGRESGCVRRQRRKERKREREREMLVLLFS